MTISELEALLQSFPGWTPTSILQGDLTWIPNGTPPTPGQNTNFDYTLPFTLN